jgi:hypothetical protein
VLLLVNFSVADLCVRPLLTALILIRGLWVLIFTRLFSVSPVCQFGGRSNPVALLHSSFLRVACSIWSPSLLNLGWPFVAGRSLLFSAFVFLERGVRLVLGRLVDSHKCFSQQPSPGPTVLASSYASLIVYDQPLGSAPVLPLYSSSLPVSACSCSSSMPPATDLVFPRLGSGIDLRSGLLLTHFIFLSFCVRLTALARLFPNRFLAEELSWIHLSRAGFLLFLSLCGVPRCEFKPSPFQHTNGEARPASLVFGS